MFNLKTVPTIYQPGVVPNEIYSGVPSFMGMPTAKTAEELKQYDFAVMGVPFEGGCTYGGFSSCVVAPKTIRSVSTRYVGYLPDYDFDTFDYMSCCDYGDIPIQNGSYEYSFASMRKGIGEILDAGCVPITFGGDHSISYPLISELCARHKKRVGVLHFDAHLDTMPAFGDDLYSRCSPFNRLYGDENFDSTKIVHIGIRGPRNHHQERIEAQKAGATVITAREIKLNGWQASIQKAIDIVSKDTDVIYVTVCSDVLDAAANPQGPFDPCGPTSFEVAMMLHEAGKAGAGRLRLCRDLSGDLRHPPVRPHGLLDGPLFYERRGAAPFCQQVTPVLFSLSFYKNGTAHRAVPFLYAFTSQGLPVTAAPPGQRRQTPA